MPTMDSITALYSEDPKRALELRQLVVSDAEAEAWKKQALNLRNFGIFLFGVVLIMALAEDAVYLLGKGAPDGYLENVSVLGWMVRLMLLTGAGVIWTQNGSEARLLQALAEDVKASEALLLAAKEHAVVAAYVSGVNRTGRSLRMFDLACARNAYYEALSAERARTGNQSVTTLHGL